MIVAGTGTGARRCTLQQTCPRFASHSGRSAQSLFLTGETPIPHLSLRYQQGDEQGEDCGPENADEKEGALHNDERSFLSRLL